MSPEAQGEKTKKTFTDPICLMEITPEESVGTFDYQGKTYYFCSQFCLDRFRESPAQFLEGAPASEPSPLLEQNIFVRWTRRSANSVRGPARSAAWPWSRR
ncbi:MAG: YHS domain-containing protein [Candidatus Manganitrophus sp.]|nr:YHS domain-containing protein [Candidatus Manganitrophus sp.]WDT69909.1 MAG: YHS domain-containing protein [Candidatus Manganitrophus sp.]WDT78450.1 MAG: YHS domain-containing protein [Candidatus Manganitrophus sp.]